MYTEVERENILNKIINNLKKREEVLSIILIGSGAYGFRDKLSDIDIALVIDNLDNLESVFKKTKEEINVIGKIVNLQEMPERQLQVFLLDNYLEIDIGYYTLANLYAKRKNYKVVFDRTNKVEKIMDNSWNKMKDINRGTTSKFDIKELISWIDSILWYNVIHCVNAYYRNNKYKCYYELNEIRNIAIDLIAKRNNIESKKHRDIYLLGENDKKKIDELFIYPKDGLELKEVLIKVIDIIYRNMDYFKETENIDYSIDKDFLINYINENIDRK